MNRWHANVIPWFCLACSCFLVVSPVHAHRPYEYNTGSFTRSDGTVLSIYRHRIDGIVATDPVSVQFRLPDGTNVAATPHVSDAIVRRVPLGIEVYQFQFTVVPIASRVDVFDGYALKEITASRRLFSLFVHFSSHWVGYLVVIGLGVVLERSWVGLQALPKRGVWRVLHGAGSAFVGLASLLYAYDVLVFEPLSPVILGLAGVILVLIYRRIRKRGSPNAVALEPTQN